MFFVVFVCLCGIYSLMFLFIYVALYSGFHTPHFVNNPNVSRLSLANWLNNKQENVNSCYVYFSMY